jgi:glyoxylase-like metal-dependent hydrolase (beta-lactamase superfamily II)
VWRNGTDNCCRDERRYRSKTLDSGTAQREGANWVRIAFLVLCASVAVLGAHSDDAFARAQPQPMTAQRVARDVYYVQGESGQVNQGNRGFTSNAGFVVTRDGVLVWDALGTPELARELLKTIARTTRKPVKRVIVSHYHADHIYGLQVFKAIGAEIWAHHDGQIYLASELARERLQERRRLLAPWVDAQTQLIAADRWLTFGASGIIAFRFGGKQFRLLQAGPAHAPDDLMLSVDGASVLFAGDVFFSGRLPFVVDGNSRGWLRAIDQIKQTEARVVVPGHGAASRDVAGDLRVTEHYLCFLRSEMAVSVEALESFDEAYARIDWSEFENLPTFDAANRRNAYSVYLEIQSESLARGAASEQ